MEESEHISEYFQMLRTNVDETIKFCNNARKCGVDPEETVNIPIAENMAQRVQGLISIVTDRLGGPALIKRIMQLEEQYGALDWRVGFVIAEEVAKEKFCNFDNKKDAMEIGIRVGFSYLTGGIVAAPLEGFTELKLKKTRSGKEYFSIWYAGPIRGAGGTAAATSVILADYVRVKMGYAPYDPDENEVNRYVREISDYNERVTNLQYMPSEEELRFLIQHIPVEVNGDSTEKLSVSNFKGLPRIETDQIRGGMALVIAEGVAQKAKKTWKRLKEWGKEMGLEWGWLGDFLALQDKIKASKESTKKVETGEIQKVKPNFTYIADLAAGRPVLTYPMRKRGFRLRYGKTRVNGFSNAAIHPSTMYILNKYTAIGTQLKTERPGKGSSLSSCDSIDPPIVKFKDGTVKQIFDVNESKKIEVEEILFLGDYLVNYGDFSENNHILIPPGYCPEWWVLELEKKCVDMFGVLDNDKVAEYCEILPEEMGDLFEPFKREQNVINAYKLSEKLGVPLHPNFIYYWSTISYEEFKSLFDWLIKIKIERGEKTKIILPMDPNKRTLELIGLPHLCVNNEFIVIEYPDSEAFLMNLGLYTNPSVESLIKNLETIEEKNILQILKKLSNLEIKDKAGSFIGARMGRPEKAKIRKLTGSPHCLFPVGEEGGRLKCFQASFEKGKVTADFPIYKCKTCNKQTVLSVCETCFNKTERKYFCKICGIIEKRVCDVHGKAQPYKNMTIDINPYFESFSKKLNMSIMPDLIKGVKGTANEEHIPEHPIKGILRAKHNLYVNKDGTIRYDMTEMPMTHFYPREVGVSHIRLKELGYKKDYKGRELISDDQLVEILPQDIILPGYGDAENESSKVILHRVGNFIDDLLVNLYGSKPFYNFKNADDVVGQYVVALAPHISTATLGRIVGFSKAQGFLAHPMFHAAMRRDCDGDEACVILLADAFLNFSRQFLPNRRGAKTMDSPLVLTTKLIPSEVDDQALGVDTVSRYTLDFYNGAMNYKYPHECKVEQIRDRLHTELQYEGMKFTHPVKDINLGVLFSAYKTGSMEEKLKGQMDLAVKINAVDSADTARLVIEKHFLKDIRGNLRKFSMQEFRCVKCNTKFRRPPLSGKCKCNGRIIFTISYGNIIKYLDPSISLAKNYGVPPYLMQNLDLLKRMVEGVFGRDAEKQEDLNKWFG